MDRRARIGDPKSDEGGLEEEGSKGSLCRTADVKDNSKEVRRKSLANEQNSKLEGKEEIKDKTAACARRRASCDRDSRFEQRDYSSL